VSEKIVKKYTQVQQREAQINQYPNKEKVLAPIMKNYKEEYRNWLYTTKKKEA